MESIDKALFPNVHPGEILKDEFLDPLGISVYRLAQDIHVDEGRIHQIIKGERGISPDTAARLALFFGTSVHFWLNLQSTYDADIAVERLEEYRSEVKVSDKARESMRLAREAVASYSATAE